MSFESDSKVIGQTLTRRLHPVNEWTLLEDGDYLAKIVELIEGASTEILVAAAIIVWDGSEGNATSQIYELLCYALRRKVRVEICDPGHLGFFSGTGPGRQMRTTLAKLHELGACITTSRSKRPLHAKLVVVDRKIVAIGSHNWSGSSLSESAELSLLCESPALATAFVERFRLAGYLGGNFLG